MSYQPYTSGGSNNNAQKNSASESNYTTTSAAAAGSGYNPYQNVSSPAPAASSSYNPYGAVASSPAPPSSSSYNPYGAAANTNTATTTTSASSYNPYENIPNATAPTTATTTTASQLPDFSQALDVPPPTNTSYAYGNTTTTVNKGKNDYEPNAPVATAYPMNGNVGASHSMVNSTTYQGGPTGGIVSEGNPVKCHKVDYEIKGHEMQLVEIELDPNETVIGEAGGMMFLEDGIKFEAKFGDGSEPKQSFWKKLLAAGGRILTGESLFVTHFTNIGHGKSRVAFAAPYPGNIVPLNLANMGGSIICQRDAFLCAALGTKISIAFNKRIGSGLFGGEGFILQKMEGDGMAFMHAGGTIIKRQLNNEKIRLDTGCLVAYTQGINFDVQFSPGLKTALFGGEGLFLATLQGTGTVWMQSLPFSRMADRIIQWAPSAGGNRVGEGSMLTGRFGDLVNGDGF